MNQSANPEIESSLDPYGSGNTYFCDPSHSPLEQHGLEYLDRNSDVDDEIGQVVILGYN